MANRYWVGGSGNWSDAAAHWAASSGGAPGAGNLPVAADIAFFDASSGAGTCTLNQNVSITGITISASTLDTSATNYSITLSGSFTSTGGTFRARASIITVAGNWDFSGGTGTFTIDTSTVKLTGTGNLSINHASTNHDNFYNLEVASSTKTTTMVGTGTNYVTVNNALTVGAGTLTGTRIYVSSSNATMLTLTGGYTMTVDIFQLTYTGAGTYQVPAITSKEMWFNATGGGTMQYTGAITVNAATKSMQFNRGIHDLNGQTFTADYFLCMNGSAADVTINMNGATINCDFLWAHLNTTAVNIMTIDCLNATINADDDIRWRYAASGTNTVLNLRNVKININGDYRCQNTTITTGTEEITFANLGNPTCTMNGYSIYKLILGGSGYLTFAEDLTVLTTLTITKIGSVRFHNVTTPRLIMKATTENVGFAIGIATNEKITVTNFTAGDWTSTAPYTYAWNAYSGFTTTRIETNINFSASNMVVGDLYNEGAFFIDMSDGTCANIGNNVNVRFGDYIRSDAGGNLGCLNGLASFTEDSLMRRNPALS